MLLSILYFVLFKSLFWCRFVGVHLSGWLVQTTGSWTSVFLITAALQVVGFVVFLTFASAENQFDKDTRA